MRTWICSLLCAAFAGTGCATLPSWQTPAPAPPPPPPIAAAKKPARSRQMVTPEQVSDGNAWEAADALLAEMDSDAQNGVRSPADPKATEEKPAGSKRR